MLSILDWPNVKQQESQSTQLKDIYSARVVYKKYTNVSAVYGKKVALGFALQPSKSVRLNTIMQLWVRGLSPG